VVIKQSVSSDPIIRISVIRICLLILWQVKSKYLKENIRVLRLFAKKCVKYVCGIVAPAKPNHKFDTQDLCTVINWQVYVNLLRVNVAAHVNATVYASKNFNTKSIVVSSVLKARPNEEVNTSDNSWTLYPNYYC